MPVKQPVCLPILPPMGRDVLWQTIAAIGYPAIEIWGRGDEGYQGDCTDWGLEVVERVDSARVTRLYDIYHMQIMEGDVIRTIGDRRDGLRRLCRTRVCAQGRGGASAAAGFCVV